MRTERPRIVVLDGATSTAHRPGCAVPPGEPAWDELAALGELVVYDRSTAEEALVRGAAADVVLTNKVRVGARELAAWPRLRLVSVLATGTNVIDHGACKERGVVVCNVPGYSTESVVAHVFSLLLELRLASAEHAQATPARWPACPDFSFTLRATRELAGSTFALVGVGTIGRRVGAVAHAFGMHVIAARQRSSASVELPFPLAWVELDEAFARADVLSLHCPLTETTRELVNARRLALMRPSALLINTARGPLIDEGALEAALRSGALGGAGLDVLSVEPPPADHPLLRAPRCLVTPHIAWATQEARGRLLAASAKNVAAFLAGAPVNAVLG